MSPNLPLTCNDLFSWHSPTRFDKIVRDLSGKLSDTGLLSSSEVDAKLLREGYVLSIFARAIKCDECRLKNEREQFPDAEVRLNNTNWPIEIAELLDKDRKRGEEYKDCKQGEEHLNPTSNQDQRTCDKSALVRARENWICWFVALVKSKGNLYGKPTGCHLVIYNNTSRNAAVEVERISDLAIKLSSHFKSNPLHFEAIWHLQPNIIHQVHPTVKSFSVPNWGQNDF